MSAEELFDILLGGCFERISCSKLYGNEIIIIIDYSGQKKDAVNRLRRCKRIINKKAPSGITIKYRLRNGI